MRQFILKERENNLLISEKEQILTNFEGIKGEILFLQNNTN